MKGIDVVLPDDVLLEIFYFYIIINGVESWQSLIHVCRRWRGIIFESPRRLNLRLLCTQKTPTRDKLGVWPALPIIVAGNLGVLPDISDTGNIIAALGHSNRVCQLALQNLDDWQLEEVLDAMRVPFPELTDLSLSSWDDETSVIPDSFLGGSAPRLRSLTLEGIPFPGLPTLLLSATHLVQIWLTNIPDSGYVSPEAMVVLLSVLSRLETLSLEFQYPQSRLYWETQSLPPRSLLPTLCKFHFKGVTEYLEDFVAMIDAPRLEILKITFFEQIDFDTPRLAQFINRTSKLGICDEARVQFSYTSACVLLGAGCLQILIKCSGPDLQLSSVAQICNSFLPSAVEDLYIEHGYSQLLDWHNRAVDNTLWIQLLLPFTAVKNLYLSVEFMPGIAAALQDLVDAGIIEVLPSLQNIFVQMGPFQENFGQFVAARELSGHPIAIFEWHRLTE